MADKKSTLEPKIRFKGYTDAWEQRKLGEVLKVNSGKDYKHLNTGNIPVYGTGGYMLSVDESLSEVDAIGIGRKGTIDKPQLLSAPFWTVDTLFFMTPLQSNVLLFLYALSQNIEWAKMDESTGVPSLSKMNIENVDVNISEPDEQAAIGTFFRTLDDIIALHQRKLDGLKELKQGYFQQMFPQAGECVPRVRFDGFDAVWEMRKISEFVEEYIEKTVVENQYPVLTSSQQRGIIFQEEYFANRQVTTDNNIGYFVLPKGYFTYRSRSDNGVFKFNRNDLIENGIISYFYPVFKIINGDSDFFLQIFNCSIIEQVAIESEGTGQRVLSFKKFKNISFIAPTYYEQKSIGYFFRSLDEQINIQTQKIDHLKRLKSAYLQKMFV